MGPDDWGKLSGIERLTGSKLEREVIPGLEPTRSEPRGNAGRGRGNNGGRNNGKPKTYAGSRSRKGTTSSDARRADGRPGERSTRRGESQRSANGNRNASGNTRRQPEQGRRKAKTNGKPRLSVSQSPTLG